MQQLRLSNNQLKIIAMITMAMDHIGVSLFPQVLWLRIIGRLAMPIYAYMIAEGCRHTRSQGRYLATLALMGIACQLVYFFAMGSLYMSILITFSLSIVLCILLHQATVKKTVVSWICVALAVAAVFFLCEILPRLLPGTDYGIDYGFFGVLLPVLIFLGKDKFSRLNAAFIGLCCISLQHDATQWFSLLALPLLALYNGQRGKWKMKWFFYFFYPVHLVLIHFISLLI